MQTSAFLPTQGAIHHQRGDGDKVAEFQEVGGDLEIPVKLLHLGVEIPESCRRPLESLVGANDPDIVPHEATHFFPVVRNHDEFIDILDLAGTPFGKGNFNPLALASCGFFKGPMRRNKPLKQGIAGESVRPMESGASDLADCK